MLHSDAKVRCGFTLTELLVVIAIIGVLLAILVPAVQMIRASANRLACQSNLRQIGIALHRYANDHGGRFPPSSVGTIPPAYDPSHPNHGPWPFLLRDLEQQDVLNEYHFEVPWFDPLNESARMHQLKILQCPSAKPNRVGQGTLDPSILAEGACTDYAPTSRVDPNLAKLGLIDPPADSTGTGVMFTDLDYRNPTRSARFEDIWDGASNTIVVAECAGRPEPWVMGKPVPGYIPGGQWPIPGYIPGGPWASGPNNIQVRGFDPATGKRPGGCAINCTNEKEVYGFHPGGANVLFADGHVKFLKEGMNIRILAALVTRAGGEAVSNDEY